jgi:hypothetical protein
MDRLAEVNKIISSLTTLDQNGYLRVDQEETKKKLIQERSELQKKLKKLEAERLRAKKRRRNLRTTLEELRVNPEVAEKLKKFCRDKPSKPRIEEDQPQMLKTIVDIVTNGAAADERRRSEVLRSCLTLDDLVKELRVAGYSLSRTATYLRLQPFRANTIEGRRHVATVPVKLIRTDNNLRKQHPDTHFARATIRQLLNLAVIIGYKAVFVLSQDDKARVPLGLAAANKQAPILMHLHYRVSLPDHDWVVASRHKLIPSVYAALDIGKDAVGYSGPTYIAIRSGKHDKSTAYSHSADFLALTDVPEFREIIKVAETSGEDIKPVVILLVDGGPDENPRYPKTLRTAIGHFKRHNLDAIFIACHAPGQSAFNAVERRMAPLSHDVSGLILPHDSFGSHLDSRCRTTDIDLEKLNFSKAGQLLAEVWSRTVIDGHPVIATYVDPDAPKLTLEPDPTEHWKAAHVRQSQYSLQIVKCYDRNCCPPPRSSILTILPDRFIPPPVRYVLADLGPVAAPVGLDAGHFGSLEKRLLLKGLDPKTAYPALPFDYYCPSVQDKLAKRVCGDCGLYFSTVIAMNSHRKIHNSASTTTISFIQEEEEEEVNDNNANNDIHV